MTSTAALSYTVARRTRKIGVRVALGASARRVISSIFRRSLTQVTIGVLAGIVLFRYAVLMLGVCVTACIMPTIRAMPVQPTEALRAEYVSNPE